MLAIEEKLDSLPARPGVYLMRDGAGKVIYIGKAKDLRARVRSYFRSGDGRSQIQFLLRRVEDIETLITSNEKEALVLENNLIKQYRPRYNLRLKDDKSYLSIKVNVRHPWRELSLRGRSSRTAAAISALTLRLWPCAKLSISSKNTFFCGTVRSIILKTAPVRVCSIRSSAAWPPASCRWSPRNTRRIS